MEKLNKQKTTQEDLQKDSLNEASGLIYWEDYIFDQTSTTKQRVNDKPGERNGIEQQPAKL